jgi:hypothetical protein
MRPNDISRQSGDQQYSDTQEDHRMFQALGEREPPEGSFMMNFWSGWG